MKSKLHFQKPSLKLNLFILMFGCFLIIAFQGLSQSYSTKNYAESFDDFMNPDRGFYHPYDSEGWGAADGIFVALNESELRDRRIGTPFFPGQQWDSQGYIDPAYSVNTSIILRHYVLDDFTSSNISQDFLNKIQTDFNRARNAGVRMILRFSYVITPNVGNCNEGFNCPEYGDASKEWVKNHIAQLTPYLRNNEDVIMVVQQGFIGTWGEQYYTDHFGDASVNGQGYLNSLNWAHRIEVLKALLDAVPQSRMVQVRYPQMKMKFVEQYPAYYDRIGYQNDCFLSSYTDVGTYIDFSENDPNNNDPILTRSVLRNYADSDGDFVAVGGETCGASDSDAASYIYNNCESNGGSAVTEMAKMNWSFLNSAYSYVVNNDWVSGGCIDEIKRKLGYRFVLNNGQFQNEAQIGDVVNFSLNLENAGFAAPFNKRVLYMMLKNASTNTFSAPITITGDDADIRTWRSGTHNLNLRFELPGNIPSGDYSMHLHIADLSKQNQTTESIRNNPAYSIRLANKFNGADVWDANTGYNNLNHTINIQNMPPPPPPMGNNCINIDSNFADWQDIAELRTANNTELSSIKVADDGDHIYIYLSGTLGNYYQIFLDTDGNRVRSNSSDNEYLNSKWPQTGFNYMIENGSLLRFVTDNPWNWPFIASLQPAKTTNGLELMVPKYLLPGLSNANINIAANTLDANWNGSAYLPANGNYGASYEPYSSSPCIEEDVCILINGDDSDWQNLSTTHLNTGSLINELKVADNTQDLFVYINSTVNITNHTPQIFFDTDNNNIENGSGDEEFIGTDWSSTGFNYMMEYNTFYKYIGDGQSWDWLNLGQVARNYGDNNILEFKVSKSKFQQQLNATIKVAGYYYDYNWKNTNKLLPSNGSTGISYAINNSTACNGLSGKTENLEVVDISKNYYLSSSKIDENLYKKSNQNCLAVDGNANEWSSLSTFGYASSGSLTHVKIADNQNEILFYLEGGLDVNNQIYLNSDVNNITLNRYNISQWEYTGFNYLIENDQLFEYNGDGTNWSWLPVGVISHSISENVLEISVQKNQLNNLSNSIGFAATSLNVDYKETGAIPASNSALNYLMGTKDLCNIKPACLTINGDVDQWLNINAAAQLVNGSNLQSIKVSDGSESLYILLEGNMDVHQSIFIDTDNDADGSNEYTVSNWSLSGFNYLIEEGDLFIYQGDGVSWDWQPIGAVNMITSKYWTELSIKKYLLGNITGKIQVAASSFDAFWAETSFIPNAEKAVAYTPSTNNLSLFFHQNGINFHQAYNILESSANLSNSNTNEAYKAGQLIKLKEGFSSPPLTNFSAHIEECE